MVVTNPVGCKAAFHIHWKRVVQIMGKKASSPFVLCKVRMLLW